MLTELKAMADDLEMPLLLDPISSAEMKGAWKKAFGRTPTAKDQGME